MECKRCTKKIDDLEIYCEDCKKILNKELDELIDENKKLNELEATIEIETIHDLKDDLKEIVDIKEDTKEINVEENLNEVKKDNKNKIIIIISIISILLVILIVALVLIFNTKEEKEKKPIVDYEKVINEYGILVEYTLENYLNENEELPSWEVINNLIKYDKYNVICSTHKLYKDGNIYLDNCKVDNKKVKYSYGKEQEEIIGKEITIYKIDSGDNYFSYDDEVKSNSEMVGTITCKTEDCEVINAYEKYVIIKENDKNYLYNYENNILEFGPFEFNNTKEDSLLIYNNKLYGIIYNENNIKKIYSIEALKSLENIEGDLLHSLVNLNPTIMYKYGYAIFENNGTYEFVNLNTGNVSYSIKGTLNSFIEDSNNNIVYITTQNKDNKKITIYNSNGKKLFDGKEFSHIRLVNNNLIVANNTNYYVYDSKLKLKLTSKDYDNILSLYDDFIVVIDNDNLEIVDLEDKVLATYDLKWDSTYTFNTMLSGKFNVDNKDIIYLVIETDKDSFRYYYIPDTKEFGLN